MELFRVGLIITGVLLLGIAWLAGRRKRRTNVYHRAAPAAYDPSLDELSVPLADAASEQEWQAGHNDEPDTGTSGMVFDADKEISASEIDAALPSSTDYRNDPVSDPVQTEIGISEEFDEIDLDLDERTERADAIRVTSFASAVKQASDAGGIDRNFSEEFESYSENSGQSPDQSQSDNYGEPVHLAHFEEKLVTVHVAAPDGRRFYGSDLKAVFDQHGYSFGRMSIYHCALDGDKVFSIANMVKPGTFNDEQMSSFETPGLTLFMRLPIELDADVAFNFLITEAKGLADELGGHLRDGNRNPLSEQTIQHMRDDIQQYVFRSKQALHTS